MEYVFFAVLFVFAITVALYLILKPAAEDKKARNGVKNSDPFSRNYSFLLDCSQSDAVMRLAIHNVCDMLEYRFDDKCLTITFMHSGASIPYQLAFYIFENKTYLLVTSMKPLQSRSNIPLKINRFFIDKIGAAPVSYTFFESVVRLSNQ